MTERLPTPSRGRCRPRRRPQPWLAAAGLALAFAAGAPALAAEPLSEPPAWSYQIAHDLMSPFCPGRTLAECPSPQADQLRLWILTQAAAGASRGEVEQMLLERYGDQILSAPRAEGWGLAAYVLPVLGFAVGGLVVALVLRGLVRRRGEEGTAEPRTPRPAARVHDPDLERLLDEELSR